MKLRTLYILLFLLIGTVAFAQEMRVVSGVIKDSSGTYHWSYSSPKRNFKWYCNESRWIL